MAFLSPIWLLGLLPWAAVSMYLMSGQRRRVTVPFLALWVGPVALPTAKRAVHRPPWFVLLLILSMLLAVLAAAGPVVVLTNRQLDLANEQPTRIPPVAGVTDDVGIAAVAARSQPTPQVMVRLRNQSNRHEIQLRIISSQQSVAKTVPLPPAGQTRDYFLNVPGGLAESVRVEIDPHDMAPVNDRAWLAREASWPVVEARMPLPAAVERMIAVYAKSRPGNGASRHVTVGFNPVPQGQSGVWLQGELSTSNEGNSTLSSTATVTSHAVTAHVAHWPGPADSAAAMPSGFTPVVSRAGRVLVAVRDSPAKQVWVNLDWDSWSASPDFVIFFTNVFDWLGNGAGGKYIAHPISRLGKEWKRDSPAPAGVENGLWPGLYRRADGTLRAVNAPEVKWNQPPKTDRRAKLARQQMAGEVETPFAPGLCAAAVIAALLAVCCFVGDRGSGPV